MSDEAKMLEKLFLKACKDNDLKRARACIDLDVDVNCRDREAFALWYAVENDNLELCQLLLAQDNINVNQVPLPSVATLYQRTSLIEASSRGHTDIMKLLAASPNINLNARDKNGETAKI